MKGLKLVTHHKALEMGFEIILKMRILFRINLHWSRMVTNVEICCYL
jgi:hypothetical protein